MVHTVSITKQMYGWSKYGGARHGLVKGEAGIWYCQCCKAKCTKGMPQYMFPLDNTLREFVRLCSICSHLAKTADIHSYSDLISAVRKID